MGVRLRPLSSPQANMADSAPEIWKASAMADHFEKIQKLPEPVAGVPNFRRVPGYKVYCCGQPTAAGIEACLEKVTGNVYPKDGKIIWFNLRQECSVFVNGNPFCARPANKIGEYAELGAVTSAMLEKDEPEFLKVCDSRAKENGGKLKTIDVNKKEAEVEVKDIKSLSSAMEDVKEKFPGLTYIRVPVCNSAAPNQVDFEVIKQLVSTLKDGAAAKNECDKVIDKNGTPKTGGTGIKQLRENIAESKLSYEIMDDAAQAFLKCKIMDNIQKYYYLIVFTVYMREAADLAREAV